MSAGGNLNIQMDILKNSINFSTGQIVNINMFTQVVEFLESYKMTREDLTETQIGNQFNSIRKRISEPALAKRLKNLVRLWFREEEERKAVYNSSVIVNGDDRSIPNNIPVHSKKTHSSYNNTLPRPAPTPAPTTLSLKISIPLKSVSIHRNNIPIIRFVPATQTTTTTTTTNISNNNSHKHSTQPVPKHSIVPTSSQETEIETQTQPQQVLPEIESINTSVTEQEVASPLGETPPPRPSLFPFRSDEGITMQDGSTFLWEDLVVIEESSLVIRPYTSLIEWEDQLTLRPTL